MEKLSKWLRNQPPHSQERTGDVSNAEIALYEKCQTSPTLKEKPLTKKTVVLWSTVPDQMYQEAHLLVYLDGEQVHRGERSKNDWVTDQKLMTHNWFIIRWRHRTKAQALKAYPLIEKLQEWRLGQSPSLRKGGCYAQYEDGDVVVEGVPKGLREELKIDA